MNYSMRQIAGIQTVLGIHEASAADEGLSGDLRRRSAVILFHGYGANARDLAPLASEIGAGPHTLWLFPEGNLALDSFGSRAWWQIDLVALGEAVAEGRRRDRTLEMPPGLPQARETALRLLAALETEFAIPAARVVLGGFSQGAMLATDTTLHLPVDPAGLLILSGTLLCQDVWAELAQRHRGLGFFQSHGEHDLLLDIGAARELNRLLLEAGLDGSFLSFPGGHEIPGRVIEQARLFLASRLAP